MEAEDNKPTFSLKLFNTSRDLFNEIFIIKMGGSLLNQDFAYLQIAGLQRFDALRQNEILKWLLMCLPKIVVIEINGTGINLQKIGNRK